MNAAGIEGSVYVDAFAREMATEPITYFIRVTPLYRGVPYETRHSSELWIDANGGKVVESHFQPIPRPPVRMEARITEGQARAIMTEYLFSGAARESRRRWPVPQQISEFEELLPVHLCLSQPPLTRNPDTWFNEDDLADARAGRARLVYYAVFGSTEYPGQIQQCVYLDAGSGRLTEVETGIPMGGRTEDKRADFKWSDWKAPIEVRYGKRTKRIALGEIKPAVSTKDSSKLVAVVLGKGKRSLLAMYSPAHGTVAVDYLGKRSVGTLPGPMRKALASLTAASPRR